MLPFLVRMVAAEFLQPCLYMQKGPIFICGTWSETLVPWDTKFDSIESSNGLRTYFRMFIFCFCSSDMNREDQESPSDVNMFKREYIQTFQYVLFPSPLKMVFSEVKRKWRLTYCLHVSQAHLAGFQVPVREPSVAWGSEPW